MSRELPNGPMPLSPAPGESEAVAQRGGAGSTHSRRDFLRGAAGGVAALGVGGLLAACGSSSSPPSTSSTTTSTQPVHRRSRGVAGRSASAALAAALPTPSTATAP